MSLRHLDIGGEDSGLARAVSLRERFTGDLVRVVSYRCLSDEVDDGERWHLSLTLTFSFRGASLVRWPDGRSGRLDPSRVMVQRPEQPYVTRHPWGCGCAGVSVLLRQDVAETLCAAGGLGASADLPLAGRQGLELREIVGRLARRTASAEEVEERLLALCSAIVCPSRGGDDRRRAPTAAAHRRTVETAWQMLQERFREGVRVDEVARSLAVSPDHLLRVFRRGTGLPLHRYVVRLRLAAALDRLAEGCADLSRLAHELGFASHAHLTDVFRREIGATPSAARERLGATRARLAAAAHTSPNETFASE